MHDLPLITTIAAAFAVAWVLGIVTQKLRLSPIVGYLLAGIVIGPHTPGFVGDVKLAGQLAEIGVMLLMFGVGLHFHLGDLLAVKRIAVPGAIGQSLVATLLGVGVAAIFGWSLKSGMVLGMAMAVASTVVLLRVLMDNKLLDSPAGHVAVGWLIVEDLFTVVVLVLIPALGDAGSAAGDHGPQRGLAMSLLFALLKLAVLVALLLLAGSKIIPWIMVKVAKLRSHELFTLTVLVMAIAVAAGSQYLFGASMALGAFLAGMVVGQSPVSQQAAADVLPLRDAFAVLFFSSVGMLFDPKFVIHEPLLVLSCLSIVMVGKPLAAMAIVAILGYPARTGIIVAFGLAQIGEFSFILSELGKTPQTGRRRGPQRPRRVRDRLDHAQPDPHALRQPVRAIPQGPSGAVEVPQPHEPAPGNADERSRDAKARRIRKAPRGDPRLRPGRADGRRNYPRKRARNRRRRSQHGHRSVDHESQPSRDLRRRLQHRSHGPSAAARDAPGDHAPARGKSNSAHRRGKLINPDIKVFVRAHYISEREDLEQVGADDVVYEEAEAAVSLARRVLMDRGADIETVKQESIRIRQKFMSRH